MHLPMAAVDVKPNLMNRQSAAPSPLSVTIRLGSVVLNRVPAVQAPAALASVWVFSA